ncbi:protein ACCELERATED CELL DEATH 6-like [Prosopis cineraria]|uniref:protein ACCELERATED CELL DEATH 6-like n=1 Tax=Prosopis cineraria TaxID=364024 RepID=UPI00240F47A5|nr:protein ACCELERATED CELL DEATH 6-like [Prosopis cineraria]
MRPNDSNWKAPSYGRLEELLKKQFSSSVNHVRVAVIDDTMSYELYDAVRDENGDVSKFLDVLERVCTEKQLDCSTVLNQATPTGDSLLHVAAEHGAISIAELLVDNNFLLIVTNNRKDTALHVAARAKNIGVMRVILSKFDDASSKDNFIMLPNKVVHTALHEAILSKYFEGFDFLLSEQSDSTWPLYWDTHPTESPIYLAVQIGDVAILRHLLQIPFPSDRVIHKSRGNSPLHAAISERNIAFVKEILDNKKELKFLKDENENTPLHYAAYAGYVEGVRELLKESTLVPLFQRNSQNNLPIHVACGQGHVQVVEELLRKQGPCTTMRGQNEMVKYLLNHSKVSSESVNEKDLNGDTPLHLAARKLYLWTLFHLSRDKRMNVNLVNNRGLTAHDIVEWQSKIPKTRTEYFASKILKFAGASLKKNKPREKHVDNKEWNVNDGANTLIIVAVLVATVTFAAGFTVPGGVYNSDDAVPKERGMAVLTCQTLFKIFMAFNTIAMYCSTIGSIILLYRHLGDRRFSERTYYISRGFVQVALVTMPVAFMAAIRLVVSNNSLLTYLTSVIAIIFIFLVLFLRILAWFHLGIHIPILRRVGELLLWIIIILFYGGKDNIVYDAGEIHQNDEDMVPNTVKATQEMNHMSPSVLCADDHPGIVQPSRRLSSNQRRMDGYDEILKKRPGESCKIVERIGVDQEENWNDMQVEVYGHRDEEYYEESIPERLL